ncbi:asparagine synthase (glutamine-hydrolyzing), partial [bacterium]|nr:asparagine synthase (glutamine-hydrolyzing) [bacterium]
MCGICGILYKDGIRQPDKSVLKRMCDTLVHRGPDDEGQVVLHHVGLGMRRLSIIDLSGGHQPLSNEDESIWIVCNGEIYNYRELQAELQQVGHHFRTKSDTEVILHGYETWGIDVCKKLNGMFGFALYDGRNRKLFLVRDRIGIKPLYYYQDEEKLAFGSEIKAILQGPNITREMDLVALNNYLTFEYIPSPRSIFKQIRKLKPGHWLCWHHDHVQIRPYWKLSPRVEQMGENEAQDRLSELLKDSVRLQLVSDVPLGDFLSGGIDSSIVVSLMAGLVERPVKTFSIGFKE